MLSFSLGVLANIHVFSLFVQSAEKRGNHKYLSFLVENTEPVSLLYRTHGIVMSKQDIFLSLTEGLKVASYFCEVPPFETERNIQKVVRRDRPEVADSENTN